MKPSALRPGVCIRRRDRTDAPVLRFISRDGARRQSVLQSEVYRGQTGAADTGHVVINDYDMARHYERAEVMA